MEKSPSSGEPRGEFMPTPTPNPNLVRSSWALALTTKRNNKTQQRKDLARYIVPPEKLLRN